MVVLNAAILALCLQQNFSNLYCVRELLLKAEDLKID